ncbi:hypothetical protein P692DRAFT_20820950 [Suillus brevipes Sb2]|nr:hypothetical protein P692DRAFT_20820950 [Suillus brevipes Sb2]
MEENSRRKEKMSEKGKEKESALTMKEKNPKKKRERKEIKKYKICKKSGHADKDCWFKDKQTKYSNCHKGGHTVETCWSKGGGQAGAGPSKPPQKRARKDNANIVEDVGDVVEDAQYYEEEDVAFVGDEMEEVIEETFDVPRTEANNSQGKAAKLVKHDWLADSGTTSHITKIKSALTDYVPLKSHKVTGISNQSIKAEGRGTVELTKKVDKQ